jgi:hypothetical protein
MKVKGDFTSGYKHCRVRLPMKVKGDFTSGYKHCRVRLVCNAVREKVKPGVLGCCAEEFGAAAVNSGRAVPRGVSAR